jgi:hypothetical protein
VWGGEGVGRRVFTAARRVGRRCVYDLRTDVWLRTAVPTRGFGPPSCDQLSNQPSYRFWDRLAGRPTDVHQAAWGSGRLAAAVRDRARNSPTNGGQVVTASAGDYRIRRPRRYSTAGTASTGSTTVTH